MHTKDARLLGNRLAEFVETRRVRQAVDLLSPILAQRTPFRLLDVIGIQIGHQSPAAVHLFLDLLAEQKTMGGWVVIASALRQQLNQDLLSSFSFSRGYSIAADVWYAADILGERVPGPALVAHFEPALNSLALWREDPNRWPRRMVGVAVHYWAKYARGKPECLPQAGVLLDFLVPMFEEREQDVIKGVGWGLKTLGRYYPVLIADWLSLQVARPHRALILRKALTYLPLDLRLQVMEKHDEPPS